MKGILFKPWKIKAIADDPDREWQTRRLSGLKVINENPDNWRFVYKELGTFYFEPLDKHCIAVMCKLRYQVGETVYIKEAWWTPPHNRNESHNQNIVSYRAIIVENAGEEAAQRNRWLSPLFMPQWAARYFIKILSVTPQRLQEITEEDAEAEGFAGYNIGQIYLRETGNYPVFALGVFVWAWDSINPKYPWKFNPWAWRYEFELVK